jgi:hypothetical protein
MHAIFLTAAIVLAADCSPQAGVANQGASRRPATVGIYCPRYTPPVRWFCKRCAGCAGGNCLGTQPPYFGSQPYNYRVEFDYPWSQQPVSNPEFYESAYVEEEVLLDEELPADKVPIHETGRRPTQTRTASRAPTPAKLPTSVSERLRR